MPRTTQRNFGQSLARATLSIAGFLAIILVLSLLLWPAKAPESAVAQTNREPASEEVAREPAAQPTPQYETRTQPPPQTQAQTQNLQAQAPAPPVTTEPRITPRTPGLPNFPGVTPGGSGIGLFIYANEICDGNATARIDPGTDCREFENDTRRLAQSFSIGATCQEIAPDTTIFDVCRRYQGLTVATGVPIHSSSRCVGDPVVILAPATQCSVFEGVDPGAAWSVRVGDRCVDLYADRSLRNACQMFKGAADPVALRFFGSQSCSDEFMAVVGPTTDCGTLGPNVGVPVGSIQDASGCRDIVDLDIVQACQAYKPRY